MFSSISGLCPLAFSPIVTVKNVPRVMQSHPWLRTAGLGWRLSDLSVRISWRRYWNRFLGPIPSVSDSLHVGWEPRIDASGKFPGYIDAVWSTLFWEPLVYRVEPVRHRSREPHALLVPAWPRPFLKAHTEWKMVLRPETQPGSCPQPSTPVATVPACPLEAEFWFMI